MAKRGLGKTSGRQGSRSDTRVAAADEARTGLVSRVASRSGGGAAELPPAVSGAAREAEELQALLAHPQGRSGDEARLLTDFFSVPPPAPELEDLVLDEPVRATPRAMWLTMGMLGASIALIGGFVAYQQMYVPQPVELGSDEPVTVLEAPVESSLSAALSGDVAIGSAPSHSLEEAPAQAAVEGVPATGTVSSASAEDAVPQPQAAAAAILLPAEVVTPAEDLPRGEPVADSAAGPAQLQPGAATDDTVTPAQAVLMQAAAQPPTAAPASPTSAAQEAKAPPSLGSTGANPSASPPPPAATEIVSPGANAAPGAVGTKPNADALSPGASSVPRAVNAPAGANVPPEPHLQPLAAVGGDSQREPVPSFEALLEQAENLSRRGQSAEAVTAFERALERRPGAPAALAGKAFAHLNMNDQRSAKALAEQAVAADPTSSRGWIVLGAAEEQLGSRTAAQAAYRQCAAQGVGHYVDECRKLAR